jgi:hypothetical protein
MFMIRAGQDDRPDQDRHVVALMYGRSDSGQACTGMLRKADDILDKGAEDRTRNMNGSRGLDMP